MNPLHAIARAGSLAVRVLSALRRLDRIRRDVFTAEVEAAVCRALMPLCLANVAFVMLKDLSSRPPLGSP